MNAYSDKGTNEPSDACTTRNVLIAFDFAAVAFRARQARPLAFGDTIHLDRSPVSGRDG